MAVIDGGSNTAGKANVSTNYELQVATTQTKANAGFSLIAIENDDGTLSGTRVVRSPRISPDRRLMVGQDTQFICDDFSTTAQNTGVWRSVVATMTQSQAAGYLNMNASAIVTSGAGMFYQSYRQVPIMRGAPVVVDISLQISAAPPTNWEFQAGLFSLTTTASPFTIQEGVYFKINSTGLYGISNYGTTETVSDLLLAAASIPINSNISLRLVISDEYIEFWYAGASGTFSQLGTLATPPANGQPTSQSAVPVTFRLSHTGTTSAAVQTKISTIAVYVQNVNMAKPWSHQLAGQGLMAYQGTNGTTMGSTALLTNSLAAGAGLAATNTTALGSGLGGQFTIQPTLTAATDGILCSYQVPGGASLTITPRTLYITGVYIHGIVTAAFTGGPVLYAVSLAFGHTAVSLATAESIIAKAPRRIPLGYDSYVVTAAVGATGLIINRQFQTPVVVNPTEFVQVVVKNLGTVTSAGTITYLVSFDGYWE